MTPSTVDFCTGLDLAPVTNFMPDLASSTNLLLAHPFGVAGRRPPCWSHESMPTTTASSRCVGLNLTLLATTPAGEVRTASQLREIVDASGFRRAEFRELPGAPGRVVIAYR